MKLILREILLSVLLSLGLFFVLSILLTYTDLEEKIIRPSIIGIISLSLAIGGFRISREKKEKGLISGAILGIIYIVILYLISSLLNMELSISIYSIFMIFLGIISSIVGGILGVNFLK